MVVEIIADATIGIVAGIGIGTWLIIWLERQRQKREEAEERERRRIEEMTARDAENSRKLLEWAMQPAGQRDHSLIGGIKITSQPDPYAWRSVAELMGEW